MADYYKILEITAKASEGEIRAAYRRLARKYHPDAGAGSSAETFRAVQDAYELLSDPERRKEYDRSRNVEHRPHSPEYSYSVPESHTDLRDIFSSRQGVGLYAEPIVYSNSPGSHLESRWEEWLDLLLLDIDFWKR